MLQWNFHCHFALFCFVTDVIFASNTNNERPPNIKDMNKEQVRDVTNSITKLRTDLQQVVNDLKDIEGHAGQVEGMVEFKEFLNKTIHAGVSAYNKLFFGNKETNGSNSNKNAKSGNR